MPAFNHPINDTVSESDRYAPNAPALSPDEIGAVWPVFRGFPDTFADRTVVACDRFEFGGGFRGKTEGKG